METVLCKPFQQLCRIFQFNSSIYNHITGLRMESKLSHTLSVCDGENFQINLKSVLQV